MSKREQMALEGKDQQMMYFDKTLLKKLKAYALETDTTFHKLIEVEYNQFVQALLSKCSQIDQIRMKELEAYQKQQEIQKISEENPLQVPGHPTEQGTEVVTVSA